MTRTPVNRPLGEVLQGRRRLALLLALVLCTAVNALDATIVAPALPHVLADLQGFTLISWIFTAYLLPSTVVIAIVGKLSDLLGRKPFILAGVTIFVLASAACGLAPSMPFLIAARAVQGVGAGFINGSVFATLGDLFTPRERAKYISYFIGTFTIASLLGPPVGGFLTDGPGWRWCFLVNLPVGALGIVALSVAMPTVARRGGLRDIDALGATLLALATVMLLLAIQWAAPAYGWGSTMTLGLLVGTVVLGALFYLQERRHPHAIFPPFLFHNRTFVHSNLINVAATMSTFAAVQYLPTFIQTGLGRSAVASGLVTTPQGIGVFISSLVAGQVVSRSGRFKRLVACGALLVMGAMLGLRTLTIIDPPMKVAALMACAGLGSGLVGPSISGVIQSSVPHEFMGVATAARQYLMQIAQVLAVAVFGLVFTGTYATAFAAQSAPLQAQMPPAIYDQFKDPTLPLDPARSNAVLTALDQVPGGHDLAAAAVHAQRIGVAVAMDRLFLGALAITAVLVLLAVTVREVPLRDSFATSHELAREAEAEMAAEGAPFSH